MKQRNAVPEQQRMLAVPEAVVCCSGTVQHSGMLHVPEQQHAANCRVQSAECRVQSAECRVQSAECRVQSAECRVQSAECRVQSAECRAKNIAVFRMLQCIHRNMQQQAARKSSKQKKKKTRSAIYSNRRFPYDYLVTT